MRGPTPKRRLVLGALLLLTSYATLNVISCTQYESTDCWNGWGVMSDLGTIHSAQEEFRRKDADENGKNDYWRKDIASLYTLAPDGELLKYIDISVALADRGAVAPPEPPPGEEPSRTGYGFRTLGFAGEASPDPNRFAACAWPVNPYFREYPWVFIVSDSGIPYGKRLEPPDPPMFYPKDPAAEGWMTFDELWNLRWKKRNPLWWVRFWKLL